MSGDLGDFFSLIGKAKQEKEDEFRSLVGEIDIDSIFAETKKSLKEDKKKKKKIEKQAKALEAWLYTETPEKTKIEETEEPLVIGDAEGQPKFEVIDVIKPEPLGKSKIVEEQKVIEEPEEDDTIDHALKILEQLKTKEEVQEQTSDPEILKIRRELEYLKNLVKMQGGGGEVRLEFLDDVDRDTALVDGKFLKYQSSTKTFVGADASGGGGESDYASVAGIATFATTAGIATDAVSAGYAKTAGISTVSQGLTGSPSISVNAITAASAEFSGNVTIGGTLTYEDVTNIDSVGLITSRTGVDVLAGGINVVGISTISTGVGTVHIGLGNTALLVDGDARVTGILTIGTGSITLDPNTKQVTGIDEIVVGSGASLSLAPLFLQQGKFVVDDSVLTLSGYSSSVNGTYNRQSDSFVLSTAPTASGSARFQELGGYYYFLHESNNSKIIIFNIVDGFWSAVFSSGSNFSSPSSGQVVNPISAHNIITPIRTSRDDTGRAYPPSGMGIEYSTVVTQHTSSLGIATAFSLDVTGIATASSFVGDLTGDVTGDVTGNADTATSATTATTATYAVNAGLATEATYAVTAGLATEATYAVTAGLATEATFALTAGISTFATTAGVATDVIGGIASVTTLDVTGVSTLPAISGQNINVSGIITANAFIGDGTGLTGVGGGSVISGITIREEGSTVGTAGTVVSVNFVGDNITATASGAAATITASSTPTFDSVSVGVATVSSALYVPKYTTTARDAATFAEGAIIFNTTTKKMNFYDGTNWVELPGVTLGLGMGVF